MSETLRRWRGRLMLALATLLIPLGAAHAATFDHRHAAWDALLKRHVVVAPDGVSSTVRYAALQRDRPALQAYLGSLSAVTPAEYASWGKAEQLAFLINAYNAFTVELILGRYPTLASIKDLGGVFRSPWRQAFFTLLGQESHLDRIEHDLIRARGVFDEARIHVAVVCASIGCPMLPAEAFTGERLDAQLAGAMRRFLADKTRNRYDASRRTLQVSKIFDWYGADFARHGDTRAGLAALFAAHAEALTASPVDAAHLRAALAAGDWSLDFLDYDWRLNDAR